MEKYIGQIHDTRKLNQSQIDSAENSIKELLKLDTIEIIYNDFGLYDVTTNDRNIVDFKIDNYQNNKVSLVKYRSYNDETNKRDDNGAILTCLDIKASE